MIETGTLALLATDLGEVKIVRTGVGNASEPRVHQNIQKK
jgi:hypothetical protein